MHDGFLDTVKVEKRPLLDFLEYLLDASAVLVVELIATYEGGVGGRLTVKASSHLRLVLPSIHIIANAVDESPRNCPTGFACDFTVVSLVNTLKEMRGPTVKLGFSDAREPVAMMSDSYPVDNCWVEPAANIEEIPWTQHQTG